MKHATALLLVAMLAIPIAGVAQQPPPVNGAPNSTAAPQSGAIDPAKLGVSLDRIRRELRQAEVQELPGNGAMRLEFMVEVYGKAPKINLLEGFPLIGPVPYGAPTHQEILDFLTPQEYRSPVIPVSAIASWAAQQLWNKSKKQRCEEELAAYKQLVMQGVSVAAPRCAQ